MLTIQKAIRRFTQHLVGVYNRRNPKDPKNGYWSDEVKTLKDAENFAISAKKENKSPCFFCIR
jgi:hypothetical protein